MEQKIQKEVDYYANGIAKKIKLPLFAVQNQQQGSIE